jgi:hypothetical protein
MVKFNSEQRPDVVRGRPDPGGQVNESTSMAKDAPEIRLLLQIAVASQKLRPQLCIHVSPFSSVAKGGTMGHLHPPSPNR